MASTLSYSVPLVGTGAFSPVAWSTGIQLMIFYFKFLMVLFDTQARGTTYDDFSGHFFFEFLKYFFFCFIVSICDLVHDVEATHGLF